MSKEILFRGKRIDNGEWVYGDLFTGEHPSITWWERIEDVDGHPSFELDCADVEPETVGQYTGLKDRNGQRVFHKDLWHFHGLTYTVEWDEEYAMFYLKHPSERATCDDHMKLFVLYQGEIVGTAFERKAEKV
jgi:uncharacterized phage protein (TIGR01671 family)